MLYVLTRIREETMKAQKKPAKKAKAPKKKSGDLASKMAAQHLNITPKEVRLMYEGELVTIIRTLAASVLSQTEPSA